MKLTIFLSFLLSTASLAVADKLTNTFAIYLVADEVPLEQIINGTATPQGLKLMPTPTISDAELVSYDITNHTFTVTRPARERISQQCTDSLQVPFVVVADGEPVYVGVFTTPLSSWSSGLPSIFALPLGTDIQLRINRGYPVDAAGRGEDRRNDKRVISAIEKLLRKRESNR